MNGRGVGASLLLGVACALPAACSDDSNAQMATAEPCLGAGPTISA
jgi:hypothetical protein